MGLANNFIEVEIPDRDTKTAIQKYSKRLDNLRQSKSQT